MTERLDRIETILERLAERQDRLDEQRESTQQQINSNARAIEATNESISTLGTDIREGFAQTRAELQQEAGDAISMLSSLGGEVEQTQATVRQTSEQVQSFVSEGQANRAEASQQRESNAQEHADFRVLMQSMLAEVARLWRELRSA